MTKLRLVPPAEQKRNRVKAAEAGLAAALAALAEAQDELRQAVAAMIVFDGRDRMRAEERARKAAHERARMARARRDAARHMAGESE